MIVCFEKIVKKNSDYDQKNVIRNIVKILNQFEMLF